MIYVCFVQAYVGWKVYWMCVRLMQNHMKLFSTATKLFAWHLRLRQQKARSSQLLSQGIQRVKSVAHYKIMGLYEILSFQMTKTFRDNCNTKNLFFRMLERTEKCTFSFLLYVHVCITIMLWFQEGIHPQTACSLYITLVAVHCTTCRSEWVFAVIRLNVTFLPLRP